ncbi:MAG: hypothetical protein M1319_02330 [Chloroflexi bacterium]|nr:hypothetical protein [Chloroflexota bacterium]
MYAQFCRYARLASAEGRELRRNLRELLQTQWLQPEELQTLQLVKLKRVLEHAYTHVAFYRRRFQKEGIQPGDIKTMDDFQRVPILTKDDVRGCREEMIANDFPRAWLREQYTSGSTGTATKFYYSDRRLHRSWAAFSRLCNWSGVENGCRTGVIAPVPASRSAFPERVKLWLRREKWLNSLDMDERKMQDFASLLLDCQPELVRGHHSAIWLFAQHLERHGLSGIRPKVVIGGADKLHDFEREQIEKAFGCRVVDDYGARETGQIAGQCPEGSLHVVAELNYVELIANGRSAVPGELGEVIITDLENYAMPFIRYALGDVAKFAEKPCPCGRGLPVLAEVMGRTSDFFTTPSGKLVSGHYFGRMLRVWPGMRKFRVHQPSVDKIDVLFESDAEPGQEWLESQRQKFLEHLGGSIELSFTRVDHIPSTPAGKYLFTSSEVPVSLS